MLPLFDYLRRTGGVADSEMYRTFNMGIGMVLVVRPEEVESVERDLATAGETPHRIGEVIEGNREVLYAG